MSAHAYLHRWLAAEIEPGLPAVEDLGRPPAPQVPDDPAAEAARRVRQGEIVVVDAPYEPVQYQLQAAGGINILVWWRHTGEPYWRNLNEGWHFPAVLVAERGSIGWVSRLGRGQDTELAALTVLAPIFAGLRVWRLHCGSDITHPVYERGSTY